MRFTSILFHRVELILDAVIVITNIDLNTLVFIQDVKLEIFVIFQQFECRSFASFDFCCSRYCIIINCSNVCFDVVVLF